MRVPVDLQIAKKKAAFTLAEVLITLGIIGVLAAITLTMLIGHYNKISTEAKYFLFKFNCVEQFCYTGRLSGKVLE